MSDLHQTDLDGLSEGDSEKLLRIGFDPKGSRRSGSYTLVNNREAESRLSDKGYELMPLGRAIEKDPGRVEPLLWQLVDPEGDEYTRETSGLPPRGYFIRVPRGRNVELPLQACFFIKEERFRQNVHNIILVEENGSLNIINGCATADYVHSGIHVGVTEIFIRRGGRLSYTMIHDWAEDVEVRPRSAVRVAAGGAFVSNYISIKRSRITEMNPLCELGGEGATASFNSLIYAPAGSVYDIGARVRLNAPHTSSEIVSRTISGGGRVIARGELVANHRNVRAHLECSGMLLNPEGSIQAIPVLDARHPDVDMTHEASVGRIAEDEIYYLMSRGIPQEEAVSLIVRGFLDTKILALPSYLEAEVERTLALLDGAL